MTSNGEPNMIASGISPGISNTTNISIPPMTTFLFIGVPPLCLNLIIFRGWCKVFKRVLCLFAAFTVLFCCSVPAFATGVEPGGSGGGGSGIPVVAEVEVDVVDFMRYLDDAFFGRARGYGNFIWNLVDDDVCSHAPQFGGGHSFVPRRTQVDGQIGTYYVCEYCGRAAGEVLEEVYDEYVDSLPGTQLDNNGAFYVPIPLLGLRSLKWGSNCSLNNTGEGDSGHSDWRYSVGGGYTAVVDVKNNSHYGTWFDMVFRYCPPFDCVLDFNTPIVITSSNGGSPVTTERYFQGSYSFLAGVSSDFERQFRFDGEPFKSLKVEYLPLVKCTLMGSFADYYSDSDYLQGSRVASISGTGSYGYVQDGQLYQSTTRDIFNETTNTYNNPVTGDTSNIENWTYDYGDRSYTLTTDEGDTVTVAYGDTNVTITDGGTTYNLYYLTEHDESVPEHYYTSSVTSLPTCTGTGIRTYTCDDCGDTYTETIPATGHDYQSVVTMSPSCINTGVRTFTCAVCGDVYTVSIPATGHIWQVLQTVPTVYDEGGQLVTEGYTLYQCATCGEQYKITSDSGGTSLPAPSTGGTSIDTGSTNTGSSVIELDPHVGRGFLATIAHGLTEDLPEVLKSASAWFTEFPAFYSGFTAFLKDGIVGCLPDIVRKTMGFGLSMVTFVGVVRKIIGR